MYHNVNMFVDGVALTEEAFCDRCHSLFSSCERSLVMVCVILFNVTNLHLHASWITVLLSSPNGCVG